MDGFRIRRPAKAGRTKVVDLVEGLENSPALHALWGSREKAVEAIRAAELLLVDDWGYMWVDDTDGCLCASLPYWNEAPPHFIYLDLVHELVHVKQFHEGLDLFDDRYKYVARPTELEAYRVAVAEARRLKVMTEEELTDFLYVEWISKADHAELCAACGVAPPKGA
ncbi:MAG TPA: hypothetical protein VM889_09800 [Candidatus Thermoplasmatota archaeon]|nr:hypothetical protein [Candidatus Thermoplasmatota archaeon]